MKKSLKEAVEDYLKNMETMVYSTFPPATRWLVDKPYRERIFEDHPECFLTVRMMYGSSQLPFFPICNRSAVNNREILQKAIEIAKGFQQDPRIDQRSLTEVIVKLSKLENNLK